MATHVGVYLRISDDPDGTQTATKRQRADCTKFAKRQGWTVSEVFEDVDLSAYKRVVRPEFERMIRAVEDRQIDGVIAWKVDRISRRLNDFVRLDEACEKAGGFVATAADGIDTRQSTGRLMASILVSVARTESENISLRLKRKYQEERENGIPHVGGTRPFGYSRDRSTIDPDEAALIREAVQRVYGGEGIRGICNDWRERGIRTPTGRAWSQSPLRRMLMSAALSGQREHDGKATPGRWPAILTPDDTRRLRAILGDPNRRLSLNPRKYVLTGMLRCGLCDQRLVARPRKDGIRRYVCGRQPGNDNCGKIARLSEPIEAVVKEAVCIALDGADLREFVEKPTDDTAGLLDAIRTDEDALEQLSRDYHVDRLISRAEWIAARDPINARLNANRQRLSKSNGHGTLHEIIGAGAEVRKQWDSQGLDWKRAIIKAVISHIVIEPAVKGRNFFDPSLVKIVWRF